MGECDNGLNLVLDLAVTEMLEEPAQSQFDWLLP